jgi:hypothetical protein
MLESGSQNELLAPLTRAGEREILPQTPLEGGQIPDPVLSLFVCQATETVQPVLEPLREVTEHGEVKPESKAGTLAKSELSAAVKETLGAVANHVVQAIADLHGVGLLLRAAKWVWAVVKWSQVAEGRRGVDVAKTMTLGAGFDLVLSAHAGPSPSATEPAVTAGFVPADGPDPGVLVVDGCQVSPGDLLDKETADRDTKPASRAPGRPAKKAPVRSVSDEGRVALIEVDLSELKSREQDPRNRAVALIELSRSRLVPELRSRHLWDDLIAEGVECVVYYDQDAEESVWLFLTEDEKRSGHAHITFDASGRLAVRRPWRTTKPLPAKVI